MKKLVCSICFLFSNFCFAQVPTLTLIGNGKAVVKTRTELLKSKSIETIKVFDANFNNEVRRYKAIAVAKLLADISISSDSVIEFKSADGYVKVFSPEELLEGSTKKVKPYLAIETPQEKWPKAKTHPQSPAPFYLVWTNLKSPSAANWPYQLSQIEVKSGQISPKILPSIELGERDPARRGFEVYQKHCALCHTLNLEGSASVGPDLNQPMSPVEYFHESALKRYIRNPRDVRAWAHSRMPEFPPETLPEDDLNALLAYFKHMAERR